MSDMAEASHLNNRENGFLPDAFNQFKPAAKETGKQLRGLLSGYGKDAIASRALVEAGQSKTGSVKLAAFADEMQKIDAAG